MLRNLTLKMKLSLGFGATLALLLAVAAIGYEATVRMSDANQTAVSFLDRARLSARMAGAVEKQSTGVRGFLIQGKEDLLKHDQEGQTEFAESSSKMEGLLTTEQGKRLFEAIQPAFQQWRKYADREIELKRAGKTKEAVELCFSAETTASRNELREAVRSLEDFQAKVSADAVEEGHRAESSARLMLLVCGLMGCGIGVTIAFGLTRSITHATEEMVRMIRKIADNDLAFADIVVNSNDELGQAGHALNEMKHKLSEVVQTIAVSAEHVANASEEISSGARDSAETAKNQLGQTMQATTAMHEMTTTVQQISENSQAAADSSGEAARLAERGGEVVEEVLNSMRKIAESTTRTASQVTELGRGSEEVGKIVAVIDDIADQTNLLALNAAIEAARAGEQGRGFAVVADEVRKLAERTTKATKEIAGMIESIQRETKNAVEAMEVAKNEVEAGVSKTSDSGEALKQIIEMSRKVGDMITQIATAATQQSAATEQVNGNVAHISSATQESAASAAQAAKACADLSEQALEMQRIVGRFKVVASGSGRGSERAMGAAAGR